MPYEAPAFIEIKMDAEIGSYQEELELEPEPNAPPVAPSADD